MREREFVPRVADEVLDREVGGDEAHFVAIALRYADDHALDVAEERPDAGDPLAVSDAGINACARIRRTIAMAE
jgi:hypothetical protein